MTAHAQIIPGYYNYTAAYKIIGERYAMGYDEDWLAQNLQSIKIPLRTCQVNELIIPKDSDLANSIFIVYSMSGSFYKDGKLKQVDLETGGENSTRQKDTSQYTSSSNYAWENNKIKVVSQSESLSSQMQALFYEYDSKGICSYSHFIFYKNGVQGPPLPLKVHFNYAHNNMLTVNGWLHSKTDSVIKFTQHYDSLGRLIKKQYHNRDHFSGKPNIPGDLETFIYTYNSSGRLAGMAYTKGSNPSVVHHYVYKNPDAYGNFTVQEVTNAAGKLLFTLDWVYTYTQP